MTCGNMEIKPEQEISMHWKIDGRPGVYRLQNLVNGNFYIGSTSNLYRRWKRHQQILRDQIKDNKRIYEDVIEYGDKVFCFGIIEYCEKEQLLLREQYYFEKMNPYYNIWKTVYSAKNRKYSQEQLESFKSFHHPIKDKEKFTQSLKEAWVRKKERLSEEELTEEMGKKFRGKKHKIETKKLYSIQRKGIKKSKEHNEKVRLARLGTKLINGKWVRIENGI